MRCLLCWLLISAVARPADLPVKTIVLYKHGIAYFERAGSLAAGEEARLDFKTSDMNDILKSLTVTDRSGRRITSVRYDSNSTLEQQLQDFPFQIEPGEQLSTFIDRFKGARLEVKTKDGPLAGSIVSARALKTGKDEDPSFLREQITLLLDSGELENLDLAQISSLRLTDPLLEQKLKDYLSILSKAKARGKRSVYIDSAGDGARELQISYIAPAAIWKSSYRLTLADAKSNLEGWAIVDNTSEDDWNNVELSVVSGRPISFISLLDQPRFGNRQVADLPEDSAATPEIYGGSSTVSVTSSGPISTQVDQLQSARTEAGGGVGAGVFRKMGAPAVPPKALPSTVQGASGATLGELFQYNFAAPVTIKHNQSAMLPFLQDHIAARKLLIYQSDGSEHPVNAAEITNTSGKTLDGGPITVYDAGAYAGEALVETFKAGDKRLIGYAVDYGTRVTTNFESGESNVLEIHVNDGTLEVKRASHDTRTYQATNTDSKAKTLIVQQQADPVYSIVSPKPTERTSSAYRFEVQLPASGARTLKVVQEKVISDTVAVSSATPDFLVEMVSSRQISEAGRSQLSALIDLKHRIVTAQAALDASKADVDQLTQDEMRLRQNIDSLNNVTGQQDQVRQYISRLNQNEVKLTATRDKQDELKRDLATLQAELAGAIGKLNF